MRTCIPSQRAGPRVTMSSQQTAACHSMASFHSLSVPWVIPAKSTVKDPGRSMRRMNSNRVSRTSSLTGR